MSIIVTMNCVAVSAVRMSPPIPHQPWLYERLRLQPQISTANCGLAPSRSPTQTATPQSPLQDAEIEDAEVSQSSKPPIHHITDINTAPSPSRVPGWGGAAIWWLSRVQSAVAPKQRWSTGGGFLRLSLIGSGSKRSY